MKVLALAWAIAGFVIWSVAFVTIYGLHGIGCAYGWDMVTVGPTNLQRLVQVCLWLVFLLPLLALALWFRQRRQRSVGDASRRWMVLLGETIAWAGLAATIITFASTVTASVCI